MSVYSAATTIVEYRTLGGMDVCKVCASRVKEKRMFALHSYHTSQLLPPTLPRSF